MANRGNGTVFEFSSGKDGAEDVLVVPLAVKPPPPMELVSRVDALCDDAVSELLDVGAVGDEAGRVAHTTRSGIYKRILVVSLGDAAKLDAEKVRKAAAAAAAVLIKERFQRAALWIDGLMACGVEGALGEWAGGMTLAGFRFGEFKRANEKTPEKIRVRLRSRESGHVTRTLAEIRAAQTLADAVNYTRRLAHQPANVINPATLADEARRLARQCKFKCTVIDTAQVRKMGMNGLLAVGCGAAHGPCLIKLEYRAAPAAKTNTVLVGKAVTFDTGGYSIKPWEGMEAMKFDKCGGLAVLGVFKAAADLKLKCNLVGLIAAAENAISDQAYRPGDILTMMSGKTVEVISTDAEGRLVLADALWYAQKNCDPTAIIDLATLTGGVRIALGSVAAGLMSNDDSLAAELEESGRRTHERLWRLPLWEDYKELIRGTDTDIRNSGGKREAHAIVGGMFLKEFVKDGVPWAHLDIAAVAARENGSQRGATGFGVRLLVDYLRQQGGAL